MNSVKDSRNFAGLLPAYGGSGELPAGGSNHILVALETGKRDPANATVSNFNFNPRPQWWLPWPQMAETQVWGYWPTVSSSETGTHGERTHLQWRALVVSGCRRHDVFGVARVIPLDSPRLP